MHKFDIEERRRKVASILGINKNNTNSQHITKMLDERIEIEQSIQEIHNLERFYTNRKHRDRLKSLAEYPSSEYFELENIQEQEKNSRRNLTYHRTA
jgi:hypothetical protein